MNSSQPRARAVNGLKRAADFPWRILLYPMSVTTYCLTLSNLHCLYIIIQLFVRKTRASESSKTKLEGWFGAKQYDQSIYFRHSHVNYEMASVSGLRRSPTTNQAIINTVWPLPNPDCNPASKVTGAPGPTDMQSLPPL